MALIAFHLSQGTAPNPKWASKTKKKEKKNRKNLTLTEKQTFRRKHVNNTYKP